MADNSVNNDDHANMAKSLMDGTNSHLNLVVVLWDVQVCKHIQGITPMHPCIMQYIDIFV